MINRKTVIVTGAGAHKHVGYPLANELKTELVRFGDHIVKDSAGFHSWPMEAPEGTWDAGNIMTSDELRLIKTSADRLKTSSARTLDDFLQSCDEATNKALKKYIAANLINREQESVQKTYNLDNDWYAATLRKYSNKPTPTSDRFEVLGALTIVTLNYDLYTEYRINQTLRSDLAFSDEDQAKEYVDKIEIIHPHGKLGTLDENRVYGATASLSNPGVYVDGLLPEFIGSPLNPEADEHTDYYTKASEAIEAADRVLFVGFGYHPTVMSKLLLHNDGYYISTYQNKFFGTFYSAQNPEDIHPFITGESVYMQDGSINYTDFINKYLD